MKALLLFARIIGVGILACGQNRNGTLSEKQFHKEQEALIEAHKKMLVDAGRITDPDHFMASAFLGEYGWFSGTCDEYCDRKTGVGCGKCQFGAYVFSQAAFDQAKRIYVLRGQIAEGSDLLVDVGSGAFDKDAIGSDVGYLTYCSLHGGKLHHCDEDGLRDAKVVEFIDKNTVRLSKFAKYDAEMNGLAILPPGYVDMCACHQAIAPSRTDKAVF